jgi:hypothetical protein
MRKINHFAGQPIFSQVLQLIPKRLIRSLALKHKTEHYVKSFKTYEHLVSMLFCVYQRCNSLREVSTGMLAWQARLNHLGISSYPRRSTLSDANKRCPEVFFSALYHALVRLYFPQLLPDSHLKRKLAERLFLVDSTTIELFNEVMKGAGMSKRDGRRKGGVKVHMQVNVSHHVPSIVCLTQAKENDRIFMDKISVPPGSILIFDKGYFKFRQWQEWSDKNIYWVTRLSKVAFYQVLEERPIHEKQKAAGVLEDQLILLGRGSGPGTEVIQARRVKFFDAEKGRYFEFVTNHFQFSPSHIADLYKRRWQIETLFKSVKQNYQLRYFLGENANAICIQIWCSLIADLLMKVIKNSVKKRIWSLSNLTSIIRMHLATYVNLKLFLNNPEKSLKEAIKVNPLQGQLLFDSC